jgi:hypothetical protein
VKYAIAFVVCSVLFGVQFLIDLFHPFDDELPPIIDRIDDWRMAVMAWAGIDPVDEP